MMLNFREEFNSKLKAIGQNHGTFISGDGLPYRLMSVDIAYCLDEVQVLHDTPEDRGQIALECLFAKVKDALLIAIQNPGDKNAEGKLTDNQCKLLRVGPYGRSL